MSELINTMVYSVAGISMTLLFIASVIEWTEGRRRGKEEREGFMKTVERSLKEIQADVESIREKLR